MENKIKHAGRRISDAIHACQFYHYNCSSLAKDFVAKVTSTRRIKRRKKSYPANIN